VKLGAFNLFVFFCILFETLCSPNGRIYRRADVCRSTYDGDRSPLQMPLKYDTPYGGRLVWTMKGGNLLVVHLKDKTKIKHMKRWSQVYSLRLYILYILQCRSADVSWLASNWLDQITVSFLGSRQVSLYVIDFVFHIILFAFLSLVI